MALKPLSMNWRYSAQKRKPAPAAPLFREGYAQSSYAQGTDTNSSRKNNTRSSAVSPCGGNGESIGAALALCWNQRRDFCIEIMQPKIVAGSTAQTCFKCLKLCTPHTPA
jgi:hypothetical protein